jgi:hypothetical protein
MQKAEYPEKACREGLMSETGIGYNCELPLMHAGPCASFSIKSTVERRDRYEEANPAWRENYPITGGDIIL